MDAGRGQEAGPSRERGGGRLDGHETKGPGGRS